MNPSFDPYYRWLGIPPEEQPPNHYRLLGVPPFERDVEVIQNAVDRQMMHIRTFQTGPHAAESQRLLNEIAAARACLLNREKKTAYDRRLFAEQYQRASQSLAAAPLGAPQPRSVPPPQSPMPVAPGYPADHSVPASPPSLASGPAMQPARAPRKTRRRSKPQSRIIREVVGVVVGGVVGLAIALVVLWYGFGVDPLGLMTKYAPRMNDEIVAETDSDDVENADANGARTSDAASRGGASSRPATGSSSNSNSSSNSAASSSQEAPGEAEQNPANKQTPAPPQPATPFSELASVTPFDWGDGDAFLGPVPPAGVERWRVSLFSDLANLGGQFEFAMPASSSVDPQDVGWPIYLQARGGAAPATQTLAAKLLVEGGRLKLQASGEASEAVRQQLLNTVFSFTDGAHSRDLPLRKPDTREAVLLDLDQKVITASLATVALPAMEDLVLHVAELEAFPPGVSANPDAMRLRVGEEATVEISTGLPDSRAEIQIQFEQTDAAPEVRIRPWHREGDRREEFTTEHVNSEYLLLQRKIAEDQSTLAAARTALGNIESAIRRLAGRRPANPIEATNLRSQGIALQNQRTKALSTIRRLSTTIPKMQEAASRLETIANLGQQLHKKANIHFRLTAETEGREIPLLYLGNLAAR